MSVDNVRVSSGYQVRCGMKLVLTVYAMNMHKCMGYALPKAAYDARNDRALFAPCMLAALSRTHGPSHSISTEYDAICCLAQGRVRAGRPYSQRIVIRRVTCHSSGSSK